MDNPFFSALELGGLPASGMSGQTRQVLQPFKFYLDNSIRALEKREVSCRWKPVISQRFRLEPTCRIFQVTPVSIVEIVLEEAGWYEILGEHDGTPLDSTFAPDLDESITVGKGIGRKKYVLTSDDYRVHNHQHRIFLPELNETLPIQWSGYQLKVRPLNVSLEGLTEFEVDSKPCRVEQINRRQFRVRGSINRTSSLSIRGQNIPYRCLSFIDESALESMAPQPDSDGWLIFSASTPNLDDWAVVDVTEEQLTQLSVEHLRLDGVALQPHDWKLGVKKGVVEIEALSAIALKRKTKVQCSKYSALQFSVENLDIEEKWIQLIEKEGDGETSKSDLDYFFGDDQKLKILDSRQKNHEDGFRVLSSRPEDRQILIAPNSRGQRIWKSEYPSNGAEELRVSVDTSQLKRQRDTINRLMNRPSKGHWPLIQLLQEKDKTEWPVVHPVNENEIDWQVLGNPVFQGCDKQREFVTKAMATPDFAILDGPPGTGKTTTILELIFQTVIRGKRVLLSASTHAAINNVLERIKDNPVLNGEIFPLRIGNLNTASGVEEFHFDEKYKELEQAVGRSSISKQLLVDSSNLVCGTTIGILKLFREADVTLAQGEPPFDLMIIDECSKTPFQEFLVPACYAKRWILVGDVRQLSPFTDRAQIVANLDDLMLEPPRGNVPARTLPVAVQEACFLLEQLRGSQNSPYLRPVLVPVSVGVLHALINEVRERQKDAVLGKGLNRVLIVQRYVSCAGLAVNTESIQSVLDDPICLYSSNVCFVDAQGLTDLQRVVPEDMIVLHQDWFRTADGFRFKPPQGTEGSVPFRVGKNEYSEAKDIHRELLARLDSTKWSEEVCWRLEREYWLRLSASHKRKTGYLVSDLKRLFPKSERADGRIHVLKEIAFPSILEALSSTGLIKRKKDSATTLNQGFDEQVKSMRYTTLSYQHRMHPHISAFPRQQFYPQGVLLDGSKTEIDRHWNYTRYSNRCVWVDIKGFVKGNANEREANSILSELIAFCNWVDKSGNGKPYDVAILTFYKGQEKMLRKTLQRRLPGNANQHSRFNYKKVKIKLATVDYFQGQEADMVLLSMVNTSRVGFMDSPNRLNVAVTRARYQLVIVGHHQYYSERSNTEELKNLADSCHLTRPT